MAVRPAGNGPPTVLEAADTGPESELSERVRLADAEIAAGCPRHRVLFRSSSGQRCRSRKRNGP